MITVVLRYNIYEKNYDAGPILQLAKEIKSTIRFSVVNSPLCGKTVAKDIDDAKNIYRKERIVWFIEACCRERMGAFFARPVPKCLFSQQEIRRYRSNAIKFKCYVGRKGNYAARYSADC